MVILWVILYGNNLDNNKFNLYKPKKVNKITDMYKEKYHIIKDNNQYFTEKELLNRRFKGKL